MISHSAEMLVVAVIRTARSRRTGRTGGEELDEDSKKPDLEKESKISGRILTVASPVTNR